MIIKSMSRKNKSFLQLLRYLEKEQITNRFIWNLYSNANDTQSIAKEFMQNSKYLKNARGKNYIYHEILSLEESNLSLKQQKSILYDLTMKYVQSRANSNLCFGVIHNDRNNLHMHLMISSNKISEQKRTRLSKKDFKQIQNNLEIYKNNTYPELGKTNYYNSLAKDTSKSKQAEQEIQHRRKIQTKKEYIKETLQDIFTRVLSKKELENSLKNIGFYLYKRGSNFSIKYETRVYRLKTLGLDSLYQTTLNKMTTREKRKEKRQSFKDEKTKNNSQKFSRNR